MKFWKGFRFISFALPIDVFLGKGGLMLAQTHPSASLIWPVIGFDLALVMTFGYAILPVIFTGSLLYNLLTFGSIATCLTIAIGNTLKVVVAAKVFNRPHIKGNFRWFFFSCIPAALVGGTIGTFALIVDKGYLDGWSIMNFNLDIIKNWTIGNTGGLLAFIVWLNWVIGDFLGLIVCTPLFRFIFRYLLKEKVV